MTQRDSIEKQRNEIKEKQLNIEASINYASRIQKALLPFQHEIRTYLPNHFILFKPKDVVSGDFYWFAQEQGKIIFSAIDCTGHGVPGAFMSMIADSLLTQIVLDKKIFDVSEILENMHKGIRKALKQADTENNDGMDLAMCMIDTQSKKLEYAGAHNPLLIVQNGELQKIKGTRFGIGGFNTGYARTYTKHQFSLETDTCFYIYTDGYQDQFGGEKRKKFLPRNFEAIFKKIYHLEMQTQKTILEDKFEKWKGNNPQTDDVLVIGVQV